MLGLLNSRRFEIDLTPMVQGQCSFISCLPHSVDHCISHYVNCACPIKKLRLNTRGTPPEVPRELASPSSPPPPPALQSSGTGRILKMLYWLLCGGIFYTCTALLPAKLRSRFRPQRGLHGHSCSPATADCPNDIRDQLQPFYPRHKPRCHAVLLLHQLHVDCRVAVEISTWNGIRRQPVFDCALQASLCLLLAPC